MYCSIFQTCIAGDKALMLQHLGSKQGFQFDLNNIAHLKASGINKHVSMTPHMR